MDTVRVVIVQSYSDVHLKGKSKTCSRGEQILAPGLAGD